MMKSLAYLAVLVSLVFWTEHASAFVTPNVRSCRSRGVVYWPTAPIVSMGMTESVANEESDDAAAEEDIVAVESTSEASTDEVSNNEEEDKEETIEETKETAGAEEDIAAVESTSKASADKVSNNEEEDKEETIEETEESDDAAEEDIAAVESTSEASTDEVSNNEEEDNEEMIEEPIDAADETVAAENEIESPKSEDGKKEIPWMDLLGAAAELAGALGGAAAKAASAALEDMTPKEIIDVSIPYDIAASQEYTEWLTKYNKEDPELERYEYFKNNYRRVTVANISAKKKIREGIPEGEETPDFLKLDEYANLSPEEYKEYLKSLEPKSFLDLFGELASVAGKAIVESTSDKGEAAPAKTEAKSGKKKVSSLKKPKPKKVAANKNPEPKKDSTTKKKAPAAENTFSFFGIGTKSVKKPTDSKKKAAPTKKVADGIPTLSRWKQNSDRSLTGFVRNAEGYRNGTKITTSPVPKGAKAGMVVRTSSGSRYRLS